MIVPVCAILLAVAATGAVGQHQQQIDPSYLQQYYAQVAQAAGAQADATPIVEQTPAADAQQQYYVSPQAQQIRVKDAVAQQVRAQQQQQQQYVAPSVRQYLQQQQQQQPQPKPQQQHLQYLQQPQQQIQYRPAPSPAPKQTLAVVPQRPRPQQHYAPVEREQEKEEEEEYEQNPSYQFGFDVKDDEFTNYQNRKESREGNVIKGSYSVVDSDGFIRTVTYTADPKEGFKAEVVREPTDIVVKVPTQAPPTASIGLRAGSHQLHHQQQQQPQQHQQHQQQQQQRVEQQPQYYQPQQQQYRSAPKHSQHQQAAPQPQYQYE